MNVFNRIAMIVVSLILLFIGVIGILLLNGVLRPANLNILLLYNLALYIAARRGVDFGPALTVCIVLALAGLAILIFELLPRRGEAERYVVRQDSLGTVTVERSSIADLVQHEARRVPGVLEVHPEVSHASDGLHLFTRTTVEPEVEAPALGQELQERIKTSVQSHMGLQVAEVRIATQTAPLERRKRRRVA
jgi:uncharacterized alkaline shock family protein YloU